MSSHPQKQQQQQQQQQQGPPSSNASPASNGPSHSNNQSPQQYPPQAMGHPPQGMQYPVYGFHGHPAMPQGQMNAHPHHQKHGQQHPKNPSWASGPHAGKFPPRTTSAPPVSQKQDFPRATTRYVPQPSYMVNRSFVPGMSAEQLSHASSGSSLNIKKPPATRPKVKISDTQGGDDVQISDDEEENSNTQRIKISAPEPTQTMSFKKAAAKKITISGGDSDSDQSPSPKATPQEFDDKKTAPQAAKTTPPPADEKKTATPSTTEGSSAADTDKSPQSATGAYVPPFRKQSSSSSSPAQPTAASIVAGTAKPTKPATPKVTVPSKPASPAAQKSHGTPASASNQSAWSNIKAPAAAKARSRENSPQVSSPVVNNQRRGRDKSPQNAPGRNLPSSSETDDDMSSAGVTSEDESDDMDAERQREYSRDLLLSIRNKVVHKIINRKQRPAVEAEMDMKRLRIWQDKPTVATQPEDRQRVQDRKRRNHKPRKGKPMTRGENAWVPGSLNNNTDTKEKVRIEITDILNKLTPEKYARLFKKFLAIKGVADEGNLEVLVNSIREKALLEPKFSNIYAEMCRDITKSKSFSQSGLGIEFKKSLLQATQQEFDREKKIDQEDNPEYADKSPEEIEEMKVKARFRSLGNMRFIGEMFRCKLLSPKIIHQVIKELLLKTKEPTPEQIEVLCELLTSVGKLLDQGPAVAYMDIYFEKLKELTESKRLKTRIIFLIESIIELREDKWVPRIKEEKAKKLNEVLKDHHSEVRAKEKEMREKKLAARQAKYQRRHRQQSSSESGGWQSVSSKRRPEIRPPTKTATGGPTTPTSSVAASKGKFAVFEESVESPPTTPVTPVTPLTPLPSEPDTLSDEGAMKKIKFSINSFLEDPKEDAVGDVEKNIDLTGRTHLFPLVIFDLCSNPKLDRDNMCDLLNIALEKKLISRDDISNAFERFYDRVLKEQMFLDSALIYKNLSDVAPRFISLEKLCTIFSEGLEKHPLAGAPIDKIAFFICEALRRNGDDVEETIRKHPDFIPLHMMDATKAIKVKGKLLKNEGIKSIKGELHDIWALEHVLIPDVDMNVRVERWNARHIACGLVTGIELKNRNSTLENYSQYAKRFQEVAQISPADLMKEVRLVTMRFRPDGQKRFEKAKEFFVKLGIVPQQVADSA